MICQIVLPETNECSIRVKNCVPSDMQTHLGQHTIENILMSPLRSHLVAQATCKRLSAVHMRAKRVQSVGDVGLLWFMENCLWFRLRSWDGTVFVWVIVGEVVWCKQFMIK